MFRFARVLLVVGVAVLTFSAGPLRAGWVSDNLVGYWQLNGSGATVTDSSANANNGTVHGTVSSVPGQFDNALSFYGNTLAPSTNSNYIDVPHTTSLDGNWGAFTVSYWYYGASPGGWDCFPIAKVDNSNNGFAVDANYYAAVGLSSATLQSSGTYGSMFGADNTWHNLVFTMHAGSSYNNSLYAYRDGTLLGITTNNAAFSNSSVDLTFGMDALRYSTYYGFSGALDDIAILKTGLTDAEGKSIYKVGNSALAYSMADMSLLFGAYAEHGTATTSDGKSWSYAASGLTGTPGELQPLGGGSYSVIFSDSGSAGLQEVPEPSILGLLTTGLLGLLAYAWRRRR